MITNDPARQALDLLTGPEAPALLQLAITGRDDVRLAAFSSEAVSVHHRPGADTSVRYDVRYRAVLLPSTGATDARGATGASIDLETAAAIEAVPLVTDSFVLSTAATAAGGEGVVELRRDAETLYAWRYPGDPLLPAMRAAIDRSTVAEWLGVDDAPGTRFEAEVVGHRPLRRATVRVRLGDDEAFVKTVRPRDAEALVERHRVAHEAGVGPEVVAVPMPGTVVLRPAGGVTLARALADARDGRSAPAPEAFVALLDRLPQRALELPRRTPWSGRLDFHVQAARDTHEELALRLEVLRRDLAPLLAQAPAGPVVPTHGDPYVANVFVVDNRPHALIDLDGLGPGHRVDDLATALAHLAVLPPLAPESYPHVPVVVRRWQRCFERQPHIDAVALRARVAAVIVSLIAAATPQQARARLVLAERWLARAHEARRARTGPDSPIGTRIRGLGTDRTFPTPRTSNPRRTA